MDRAIELNVVRQLPLERSSTRKTLLLLGSAAGSVYCWWGVCLFCAGLLAWASRYSMNPDGLSYLDLASSGLRPSALLNGYWSPGYPAVIAIGLLLTGANANSEFPSVHFINFLLFVFALWSFTLFFRYWSRAASAGAPRSRRALLTSFGFGTFLWVTLQFIGLDPATPDMAVAGFVFLAAATGWRLSLPGARSMHYAALGLVLGVAYYFKAVMFPLGLVYLAILFVRPHSITTGRRGILISGSVFVIIATPLVTALSIRSNRLTFGESGRLNYAWSVNGLQWNNGSGSPEEHESYTTSKNPAPKLLERPIVLDLTSLRRGTYPLWFDPSYWYRGVIIRFHWKKQLAALRYNLPVYMDLIRWTPSFIAGVAVFFFWAFHEKVHIGISWTFALDAMWSVAAFSLYALVRTEPRYVGAFLTLFYLSLYGPFLFRTFLPSTAICSTVLVTALVPFALHVTEVGIQAAKDVILQRPPEYQTEALWLRGLGLQPGDGLAVIGYAHDCYYARCARLRVIAQIPDAHEFWNLTDAQQKPVRERLASLGVKALVARNAPDGSAKDGWNDLIVSNSLRFSALLLSPEPRGSTVDSHR